MRSARWIAVAAVLVGCKGIPEVTYASDEALDGGVEAGTSAEVGPDGAPGPGATGDAGPSACRCDDPGCGACPAAPTVAVATPGGAFKIDATEVTAQEYDRFLAARVALQSVTGEPAACRGNTSYERSGPGGAKPAVMVDWCDAWAYCRWARKRLCGRVGGGRHADLRDLTDPAKDEWYQVCSQNRAAPAYPYGTQLDTQRCNGRRGGGGPGGGGSNRLADVRDFGGCRGNSAPYSDVFDMSGNAAEWVDGCAGDAPDDGCATRGGSFESNDPSCQNPAGADRLQRSGDVGFRCCADP